MSPDTSRPYIRNVIPSPNASGVDITTLVAVEFSERMDSSTLSSTNIGIYRDPLILLDSIAFSYNDGLNLLLLDPQGNLDENTRYSVVVSGTIQDYYGNFMGMDHWWNFWTGMPSGYVYVSGISPQPSGYTLEGYLDVIETLPEGYSTNMATASISPILIYLNDDCAIGNRNYLGTGDAPNPAVLGNSFFEIPARSLEAYIGIENQEVLGNPGIAHTSPTWNASVSGTILRLDGTGWLPNNEYIVTVEEGLPGLTTYPLQEDYQFVFTSTFNPIYAGYNILRLNIGPMLQMAMAYVPDDTLNRFIYEASIQADRVHPTPILAVDVPWYVEEFVIYQSKLNALYAAIMIFAASGAGVTKRLADLQIEIDARGLMPALMPIIEDLRKLRDYYMGLLRSGSDAGPEPVWVIRARDDVRRPITDSSWKRLPFRDVRGTDGSAISTALSETARRSKWTYASDLAGTQYVTDSRYLIEGRYVAE